MVGHGAWRWFTLLSPEHGVARTASAPAAQALVDACWHSIAAVSADDTPAIRIYSCHDSTLIGIMQALGLRGESWPAYATVLQLQLLEDDGTADATSPSRWWLRASLNGAPLEWTGEAGQAAEEDGLVPLEAVRDAQMMAFPSATGGFDALWGGAEGETETETETEGEGEGEGERLALPEGGDRPQVEVGGASTALDALGPVIANKDGTLARIANWHEMTEEEQETTKRLIGAQNAKRVAALKAETP